MNKVLVIDDDPLSLRLMSVMLTYLGYEIYTSQRGDFGIDMAIEIEPDMIILDLLMPKPTYDGVETAEILRRMPQFKHIPIVAISAADIETIEKLLDNQLFSDFIQKPITCNTITMMFARFNQRSTA